MQPFCPSLARDILMRYALSRHLAVIMAELLPHCGKHRLAVLHWLTLGSVLFMP